MSTWRFLDYCHKYINYVYIPVSVQQTSPLQNFLQRVAKPDVGLTERLHAAVSCSCLLTVLDDKTLKREADMTALSKTSSPLSWLVRQRASVSVCVCSEQVNQTVDTIRYDRRV